MKKDIFDKYAEAVADKFHLTLGEMFSKTRKREVVEARQMLYFLAQERPIRLSYIKRFMDENGLPVQHSTIIHGYKKASKFVQDDPDYKHILNEIQSKIK
tara:strand:+ start:218 stop:517 length:300 start_codon:yes stop_codon:yes gene_type:complete